ncbi:uncharacterized mitochondrial protein AtMg00810-like [Lathyrus oleraceus]|uniref:uncharacterized mitochondrial protein AtMg00810-like n=1 Tax=Pisum sativum TaxID=3888 RepID=UPI0021D0F648|nr:uncharacterized mitochondrial protein AtMg00810-like [Pisum sativum]
MAWYLRLSKFLIDQGYSRGNMDTTFFIKRQGKHNFLVQVYVNDIIFGSANMQLVKGFSKLMQGEFEISFIWELNYFLGLQIKKLNEGTFVCQTKYCNELLKIFGMEDAKSIDTQIPTNANWERNENGKNVDVKNSRGMIGSLIYLTTSRMNVMFSVCMCARYQLTPKESHLKVVKCILRYLHGDSKYALWYSKGSDYNLVGYINSNFSGCKSDRKSTSGTCHMFSNSFVSWHCKKHVSVALSTVEAEYIAAGSCCAQFFWLKQQLFDFDIELQHIPIMCDITSAINLTKNLVLHSCSKHIEIRHHFLRDHVEKRDIVFEHVDSKNQLANIFTKPLATGPFFNI